MQHGGMERVWRPRARDYCSKKGCLVEGSNPYLRQVERRRPDSAVSHAPQVECQPIRVFLLGAAPGTGAGVVAADNLFNAFLHGAGAPDIGVDVITNSTVVLLL